MKNLKMIISIFLVALTALGWVSYVSSGASDLTDYKKCINDAAEWTEKGLYDRAIDSYAQAIEYKPTDENWTSLLNVCELKYQEEPDFQSDYIDYAKKAVNDCENNVDFILKLSNLYIESKNYSAAYDTLFDAKERGIEDDSINTLMLKVKYAYELKSRNFEDFLPICNSNYSVFNGSYWGEINTKGVVTEQYSYIYYGMSNSKGIRLVSSEEYGSRLYDADDKTLAKFDFIVKKAGVFSEGMIAVQKEDGTYSYYDEYATELFGGFQEAGAFNNGEAAVKKNGLWGVINDKGEFEIKPSYSDIVLDGNTYFNDQAVIVAAKNGVYSLYDKKWNQISDFAADNMDMPVQDNAIAFCKDSKWGYVDISGKVIVEPEYDGAMSFSNGLAAVCKNDKWGFIDKDNKLVIEYGFNAADYFNSDGSCCVRTDASADDEKFKPNWQLLVLEIPLSDE